MLTMSLRTNGVDDAVDLTSRIREAVTAAGLSEGAVLVYCRHTTAGLMINEGADPDVLRDVMVTLGRMVPRDGDYHHAEGNSSAHIRAILVGNSVMIPVSGGNLALGTWQHVFFMEFDGPRSREVCVQMLADGVGHA